MTTQRRIDLPTVVGLAEIVTAVAVVISLVYAATELKRSQTLTSTDVETILYERMLEMDRLLIENAYLADLHAKVSAQPESLTPAERERFLAYEHIFYDSWEMAWTAHQDEVLNEGAWTDWNGWFVAEAGRRHPSGWAGNRKNHGEDFARFVDASVRREEPGLAPSPDPG